MEVLESASIHVGVTERTEVTSMTSESLHALLQSDVVTAAVALVGAVAGGVSGNISSMDEGKDIR